MADPLTLPPADARTPGKARIVTLLLVLVAAAGAIFWFLDSHRLSSAHARVEGFSFAVLAPADGQIKVLLAANGQRVSKGDVLLALDDVPLRRNVLEARAALQVAAQGGTPAGSADPQISRAIEELARQAAAYRGNEEKPRQFLEHWTAEHSRAMLILRSSPGGDAEQRAQAVADEAQARTQMNLYREQWENASRQRAEAEAALQRLKQAQSSPLPGRGLVDLWLARLAQAEQALEESMLVAPDDGLVLNLTVRQGQAVQSGEQILTFIPRSQEYGGLWVTALFGKEQALGLRIGQVCQVALEQGPTLEGVLTSLVPGNDAYLARINLREDAAEQGAMPGQAATVTARLR